MKELTKWAGQVLGCVLALGGLWLIHPGLVVLLVGFWLVVMGEE